MEPIKMIYDICQCYLKDLRDVDEALIRTVDGYRRSRNLPELTSCSRHFDRAKHTINDWKALRQVEAFFKKNADLSQPTFCQENAAHSFFEAEHSCSLTNRKLRPFIGFPNLIDEGYRNQVLAMARYIYNVLGDFHHFLDALPRLVRVTPGATSTRSRRDSLPQLKMRLKVFATGRSFPYIWSLYKLFGFDNVRLRKVSSNRVELVPKNWKTYRTIACEPEGNLPFQLAFDGWTKRRLRRFGIDLSDQSANQRRAKHASIHDDFVTVDFSKASDTISYNTVALLFPIPWFKYLDDIRTPEYRGVFGEGKYSKFSSMGNGSTFTIETLIFAAACHAVGSRSFLVYGDDVIIERKFYEEFIALTQFLGFTINRDKSFHEGPFRESCGKDYFGGIDVTPVFIRGIDKRKSTLCHVCNTLMGISQYGGKLEAFLLKLIKEHKLPLVPYNESTLSGIWIDPTRARQLGILKRINYIDVYKGYTAKYRRKSFVDSRGYYLWFLNKHGQVLFSGPWEAASRNIMLTETSSVPVFDHAYVRKRVYWHEPVTGMPDHLYWWSELISPR